MADGPGEAGGRGEVCAGGVGSLGFLSFGMPRLFVSLSGLKMLREDKKRILLLSASLGV
jgi:hypothetical protein